VVSDSNQIQIIVPNEAGGGLDLVARKIWFKRNS
jgi:tripartite-type tricarboxylate transporter receptor subunit TctC